MNTQPQTTPPANARPWERQPGESARAYAAARAYFELGPPRSLRTVADILTKSTRHLERLSSQWQWVERAAAYDDHLRQIQDEARDAVIQTGAQEDAQLWVERRRQAREDQWRDGQALRQLLGEMLDVPLTEMKWSARDLGPLAVAAARLSTDAVSAEPAEQPQSEASTLLLELERMVARVYQEESHEPTPALHA